MSSASFVAAETVGADSSWILRGAVENGTPLHDAGSRDDVRTTGSIIVHPEKRPAAPVLVTDKALETALREHYRNAPLSAPKKKRVLLGYAVAKRKKTRSEKLPDFVQQMPWVPELVDMHEKFNLKLSRHNIESRVTIPVALAHSKYQRILFSRKPQERSRGPMERPALVFARSD